MVARLCPYSEEGVACSREVQEGQMQTAWRHCRVCGGREGERKRERGRETERERERDPISTNREGVKFSNSA